MPLWAGFIGHAYKARSENIASDTLVNAYLETTEAEGEAKKAALYGRPGLKPWLTVTDEGCRGAFSANGLGYMVVGATLYEINVGLRTATNRGTVMNDSNPVTWACNGRGGEQLAVCSGGTVYVLDLLTFAFGSVALPLTYPAVMIDFIDGYLLILEASTIRVWYSAIEEFTSIDALDFFARSATSDNLVGIKVVGDRVWTLGNQTTQAYYNSGDSDNPFVPYPGIEMQEGLVSPWALGSQGDNLIWMSQDLEAKARVVMASGSVPQRLSNPAIDFALAACATVTDAELMVYEQEGHPFALWTCPSGNGGNGITLVYDAREGGWSKWETTDPLTGDSYRWRARGLCVVNGTYLVGDVTSGAIYTLDLDTFTDNGDMVMHERAAPYLSAENQAITIDQIELGIQGGVGLTTGQGSAPVVMLAISEDGGHTWDNCGDADMGAIGDYSADAIWRRLGTMRADRLVIRIRMTDPVRMVWGPGLWIRATPGTGQF